MQSDASVSVHALKFPNAGSHTIVWTHTEILLTLIGMGSALLAAAVVLLIIIRRRKFAACVKF